MVSFVSMQNLAYKTIGTFMVFEAKRLLPAFSKADVRMQLSVDDAGLKNDIVGLLGLGGHSVKMTIAVHEEDYAKALGIMSDLGI